MTEKDIAYRELTDPGFPVAGATEVKNRLNSLEKILSLGLAKSIKPPLSFRGDKY